MAPCWQLGTWDLSPSLFPTHTSASKHFLFGWNLFCWFESSRALHPLMQTMEQNVHWLPEGLIAPLVLQSLIPGSFFECDKAYSSHMGNWIGQSSARWNTPWSLGLSLGWLATVMSGKQRGLLSLLLLLPLDQWHLLTSGSGRPELPLRQPHESSCSRFVL